MSYKWVLSLLLITAITGCSVNRSGPTGSGKLALAGWLRTSALSDPTVRRQDSFYKHIEMFNEINPVWYDVTKEKDNLSNGTYDDEVLSRAKNRVKILPTLQGVTAAGATEVNKRLETEESRTQHVAEIVELVNTKGYDGIDIDYENSGLTPIENGAEKRFTNFIRLLSTELAKTNKVVSVCVTSPSAKSRQEWLELLNYVDSLKVMVYDCDSTLGPICSSAELQKTLSFVCKLPEAKGKIIIGLPLYGRHWEKNSSAVAYTKVKALLYSEVQTIMTNQGITDDQIVYNGGEAHFSYKDSTGEHIVYFQDYLTVRSRLKLISQYADVVRGVTFWELGGEDSRIWDEIAKFQ